MTAVTTNNLVERALSEFKAREEKTAAYLAERAETERRELLEGFRRFVREELELTDVVVDHIEGGMVFFFVESLPLAYRTSTADFRYRQQLYYGLPCQNAGKSSEFLHELCYDEFNDLAALGEMLQATPRRRCWSCQERDEAISDQRAEERRVFAPKLTPMDHLRLAISDIVREELDERLNKDGA